MNKHKHPMKFTDIPIKEVLQKTLNVQYHQDSLHETELPCFSDAERFGRKGCITQFRKTQLNFSQLKK